MPDCEKIVCSKGTFESVKDFMEFLGTSSGSFYNYRWNYKDYTKEVFYERIILASDLKKKYNLRTLPMQEDIVLYKGEYYPNLNYVAKGIGVSKDTLRRKLREGYSIEDAVKYCEESAKNQKIKKERVKLANTLRDAGDEKSKVFFKGNIISKIVVDDVVYKDINTLVKAYKTTKTKFLRKVKSCGSIYDALTEVEVVEDTENIEFLGKVFNSSLELCNFYKISEKFWKYLTKRYKIGYLEKVFSCTLDIVKVGKYYCGFEDIASLVVSLHLNKDDVVYQLDNSDKVEKGCKYFLGGNSYKSLYDYYRKYDLPISSNSVLYSLIKEDSLPIYKIADFVSNEGYRLTDSDYSAFFYIYFKDLLIVRTLRYAKDFIEAVRGKLREGFSIEEIKEKLTNINKLMTIVYGRGSVNSRMNLHRKSGSCIETVEGVRCILNNSYVSTVKKFMVYSDVEVMKRSYRVGSISYYLCRVGDSVEYLSGDELLEIALKSIESIEVED